MLGVLVTTSYLLSVGGCGETEKTDQSEGRGGSGHLSARPLNLAEINLPGGFKRSLPGECLPTKNPVGAIKLHGVPGEGALGPGPPDLRSAPIYARISGGAPRITYWSSGETVPGSSARALETYWVSPPSYRGSILLRGARTDRPGKLGFRGGAKPTVALRLPSGRRGPWTALEDSLPPGWRAAEIPIRVSNPGCYSVQADGPGFSYALPFAVADG